MGFDIINGYSRHLAKEALGEEEHKISGEQRKINLVDIKDVIAGIKIATEQWEKDMKNLSNVDLKYKNKEVLNEKSNEEGLADIVPFIKNNIESIKQRNERASDGEER